MHTTTPASEAAAQVTHTPASEAAAQATHTLGSQVADRRQVTVRRQLTVRRRPSIPYASAKPAHPYCLSTITNTGRACRILHAPQQGRKEGKQASNQGLAPTSAMMSVRISAVQKRLQMRSFSASGSRGGRVGRVASWRMHARCLPAASRFTTSQRPAGTREQPLPQPDCCFLTLRAAPADAARHAHDKGSVHAHLLAHAQLRGLRGQGRACGRGTNETLRRAGARPGCGQGAGAAAGCRDGAAHGKPPTRPTQPRRPQRAHRQRAQHVLEARPVQVGNARAHRHAQVRQVQLCGHHKALPRARQVVLAACRRGVDGFGGWVECMGWERCGCCARRAGLEPARCAHPALQPAPRQPAPGRAPALQPHLPP